MNLIELQKLSNNKTVSAIDFCAAVQSSFKNKEFTRNEFRLHFLKSINSTNLNTFMVSIRSIIKVLPILQEYRDYLYDTSSVQSFYLISKEIVKDPDSFKRLIHINAINKNTTLKDAENFLRTVNQVLNAPKRETTTPDSNEPIEHESNVVVSLLGALH